MPDDVTFKTDEEIDALRVADTTPTPWFTRMLMHSGLVRSRRAAEYVLLSFVIVALAVAVFLFIDSTGSDIPPEALEQPEYGYSPYET